MKKQSLLFFLQTLFCSMALFNSSANHASLAQPGQDLRTVCAGISTNVDTVLACCLSTFSVVTSNQNTSVSQVDIVQSSLDACCTTIESGINALNGSMIDEFNATFTAIAGVQNVLGSMIDALAIPHDSSQIDVIESKLDTCCLTLNSKVDALSSVVVTDFNGTFTALNEINTTVNYIELALNELSASNLDEIVNTFTALIIVSNELLGTLTQLEETAIQITNTLAALEVILTGVSSEVDVLIGEVNALNSSMIDQFNSTFTAIASLQNDLEVCCATIDGDINALHGSMIDEFNATFTAIAGVQNVLGSMIDALAIPHDSSQIDVIESKLDVCCTTIESDINALHGSMIDEFNATFTAIAGVQNVLGSMIDALAIPHDSSQIDVIESKLDVCCTTIESDINALHGSMIDEFNATFTAIAGVQNVLGSMIDALAIPHDSSQIDVIESKLDACCLTLNSKVDSLSVLVATDFNGTFTAIAGISTGGTCNLSGTYTAISALQSDLDVCCLTLNSKVDSLTTLVVTDFNNTYTAIAGTQNLLASKIDVLSALVTADFAGTFTAIAGISTGGTCNLSGTYTAISGLQSDLDVCCLTLNSKVDSLRSLVVTDFNNTYTAIAGTQNLLASKIDVLSALVTTDFAGTFTAIAGISTGGTCNLSGTYTAISALQSDLDVCCLTLNSKVDSLRSLVVTDFNNTYTAIAGTQNVLGSKIDVLSALVTTDFNGTFTAIAGISTGGTCNLSGTYTALAAISALITTDFNSTMTVLAAVSSLITADFNATMTVISATTACAPISLSQNNVSSGAILLTTTGASYCLSQNITGSIIISASDVTVDLNTHSLNGVVDILSSVINVTIKNGNIKPLAPVGSTDAAHAAIVIASTVDKSVIKNCYILCANSVNAGLVGRNGIADGGTNALIQSCFIQAGAGSSGNAGGSGIVITGTAAEIFDSTIFGGAGSTGGNGISQQSSNGVIVNNIVTGGVGTTTAASGAGISVSASTNDNMIKNCTATNGGGNGFTMLTTGTANLYSCVANYNTGNGFDLASSTGKGLINACVASQNVGCGFNDRAASLYQYIGNASEGNGSTPAVPTGDTNYCNLTVTSTFTTPSGPGFAPYYQNARRTDGTFNGTSNWDNVTLS